MKILVVYTHPLRDSFTGQILDHFVRGATEAGHSVDINDLYANGFQPVMTASELVGQFAGEPMPDDILAEQARYETSDAMVLIFPVWWWSLPAMLKGWIDRVFSAGWAYPIGKEDPFCTLSGQRKGLILCCAGASEEMYAKQGTSPTVGRQLARSAFGYFYAQQVTTHIFYGARTSVEISDRALRRREKYLRQAYEIGRTFS